MAERNIVLPAIANSLYFKIFFCLLISVLCQAKQREVKLPFLYTPKVGWINDPNGLVFANGIFHLFYQNNPYGDEWGYMSWGHATSTDLVSWEDKGIALHYNEETKEMIFSGSAVFDEKNTSGFGSADKPPLVAVYSSHFSEATTLRDGTEIEQNTEAMSIAYSTDDGDSWQFYENNPVVRRPPPQYDQEFRDFRDPKVFWYEPQNKWVMVNVVSKLRKALFYSSENLKDWTFMSEFSSVNSPDAMWECPDLFELNNKWVLLISTNPGGVAGGSGMHYYLGDFDGFKFTEDTESGIPGIKWLDFGSDYYAAVTWNNVLKGRFMAGWINNWDYAQANHDDYKGAIGLVRELKLEKIDGKIKLTQTPSSNLRRYKSAERSIKFEEVKSGITLLKDTAYDFAADIEGIGELECIFVLEDAEGNLEAEIQYHNAERVISITKKSPDPNNAGSYVTHTAPLSVKFKDELRIQIDSNTLTLYSKRGDVVFTELLFSDANERRFYIRDNSDIFVSIYQTTYHD